MYRSTFPTSPDLEAYLHRGRMISEHETAQDMVTRIVATLEEADTRFDPAARPRSANGSAGRWIPNGSCSPPRS